MGWGGRRKLTDEEIATKFGIEIGADGFEVAKRLSDRAAARTVNEWPDYRCPHCGYRGRMSRYAMDASSWNCCFCGRTMHIVDVEETTTFTLATEPQ